MNILIKGAYGEYNFGDDALMISTHQIVTSLFEKAEIYYECDGMHYKLLDRPDLKTIRYYNSDEFEPEIIIYGGGTQFFSFSNAITYEICLLPRKICLLAVNLFRKLTNFKIINLIKKDRILNRRIIAMGIGLGPFDGGRWSKFRVKRIFQNFDFLSVRDKQSVKYCNEFGLPCQEHADLCFNSNFRNIFLPEKKVASNKFKKIGIIVRDWELNNVSNLHVIFRELSSRLRAEDRNIKFIIFSSQRDIKWKNELEAKNEEYLEWKPSNTSINNFLTKLSEFDCTITMRYHGAVFSSMLGIPSICLDIEPKLRLISELIGMGSELWSKPFDIVECIEKIKKLESNSSEISNSLVEFVEMQTSLANQMQVDLINYLKAFNN